MVTKRKIRRHLLANYPSIETTRLETYVGLLSEIAHKTWTFNRTKEPNTRILNKIGHMEMNDPWLRKHVFKVRK